jgi:hypothetical protein
MVALDPFNRNWLSTSGWNLQTEVIIEEHLLISQCRTLALSFLSVCFLA